MLTYASKLVEHKAPRKLNKRRSTQVKLALWSEGLPPKPGENYEQTGNFRSFAEATNYRMYVLGSVPLLKGGRARARESTKREDCLAPRF